MASPFDFSDETYRALGADNPFEGLSEYARIEMVWGRARSIVGLNPDLFRQDAYGREIWRSKYGETSQFGWEIDHIIPQSRGGSDTIDNLQPLHWQSNREKSDKIDPIVRALMGYPTEVGPGTRLLMGYGRRRL